jgi:hypothetical protein
MTNRRALGKSQWPLGRVCHTPVAAEGAISAPLQIQELSCLWKPAPQAKEQMRCHKRFRIG